MKSLDWAATVTDKSMVPGTSKVCTRPNALKETTAGEFREYRASIRLLYGI